ncbi:hypothetical protein [Humidisolicoccus flavus]|uniref:hypothetical protein n=1 Tax=Humidisolicoccus flavus TaxID=3111414 RepID=UPI0032497776
MFEMTSEANTYMLMAGIALLIIGGIVTFWNLRQHGKAMAAGETPAVPLAKRPGFWLGYGINFVGIILVAIYLIAQ